MKNKITKRSCSFTALLLCVLLLLCSCGTEKADGKEAVTGNELTSEASENSFAESTEDTTADGETTAIIYTVEGDSGRLGRKTVKTSGKPEDIVNALIENGSLPEGVVLNSFYREVSTAWIDMNKVYGDAVCSGTYAEWQYVSVLVNSFLASYDLQKIRFTVDGEVLTTGHHGSFDYFLGYQEDLY